MILAYTVVAGKVPSSGFGYVPGYKSPYTGHEFPTFTPEQVAKGRYGAYWLTPTGEVLGMGKHEDYAGIGYNKAFQDGHVRMWYGGVVDGLGLQGYNDLTPAQRDTMNRLVYALKPNVVYLDHSTGSTEDDSGSPTHMLHTIYDKLRAPDPVSA